MTAIHSPNGISTFRGNTVPHIAPSNPNLFSFAPVMKLAVKKKKAELEDFLF